MTNNKLKKLKTIFVMHKLHRIGLQFRLKILELCNIAKSK